MDPTQPSVLHTLVRHTTGMVASDTTDPDPQLQGPEQIDSISPFELQQRLLEEINRAGRHGTPLACLLVTIGNLAELSRVYGADLTERTLAYIGSALRAQLRDFDRIGRPSERELFVILPGADGPHAETVARRVLARLRTIKIESEGKRRPLRVSVGLAAWRQGVGADELLAQTRAAAARASGAEVSAPGVSTSPPALGRPEPTA
jgi:diguanylate cyclase (GGDEF)-like protein